MTEKKKTHKSIQVRVTILTKFRFAIEDILNICYFLLVQLLELSQQYFFDTVFVLDKYFASPTEPY